MFVALIIISRLIGFGVGRKEDVIVGGQFAKLGDFPYAAFLSIQCLGYIPKPSNSWRCGSSIINQHLVLTAAHCVDPVMCDDVAISVSVGHPDRLKGFISSALSYLLHEDYSAEFTSDIALVRLRSPLKLNARVSRVALMANPPYEEEAEIAGWGRIDPNSEQETDVMKYTTHYVWKNDACLELLEELPSGTFCAGNNHSGYVLNGDSGSALVVRGYIQIGICSYIRPKRSRRVSIFTDVGYYYDWIQENAHTILCQDDN